MNSENTFNGFDPDKDITMRNHIVEMASKYGELRRIVARSAISRALPYSIHHSAKRINSSFQRRLHRQFPHYFLNLQLFWFLVLGSSMFILYDSFMIPL